MLQHQWLTTGFMVVFYITYVNHRRALISAKCKMTRPSLCPWFDQPFSFLALARLNLQNVNTERRVNVLNDLINVFRLMLRRKNDFSLAVYVF